MEEGEVQSVIMQCMLECDVVKDRRAQLYRRIIDCYTVNLTGRKAKWIGTPFITHAITLFIPSNQKHRPLYSSHSLHPYSLYLPSQNFLPLYPPSRTYLRLTPRPGTCEGIFCLQSFSLLFLSKIWSSECSWNQWQGLLLCCHTESQQMDVSSRNSSYIKWLEYQLIIEVKEKIGSISKWHDRYPFPFEFFVKFSSKINDSDTAHQNQI